MDVRSEMHGENFYSLNNTKIKCTLLVDNGFSFPTISRKMFNNSRKRLESVSSKDLSSFIIYLNVQTTAGTMKRLKKLLLNV